MRKVSGEKSRKAAVWVGGVVLVVLAGAALLMHGDREPAARIDVPAHTSSSLPSSNTIREKTPPAERANTPDSPTAKDRSEASLSTPQVGETSWCDLDDQKTASGDTMDPRALTAAHRSLPLGTKVKVEHAGTGKTVVVRINDRGPFAGERILDLSKRAAKKLGIIKDGVAKVRVTGATQAK